MDIIRIEIDLWRCSHLKKCHEIALLIGLITSVAAIVATVTTVCLLHQKKKKEDEELEHYLDCSIQ